MTTEVESALSGKATELALQLVKEKTGLILGDLSQSEHKIIRAIGEYVGLMQSKGSNANRTIQMLKNRGLKGTAEAAVTRSTPAQGFHELNDADLSDLSFEQIILDHADEFSPRAIWYARRTLGLPNPTSKPPAEPEIATQTRTAEMLRLLSGWAAENDGMLPRYTNQDVATALDMDDLTKYGRVLGNIQSRIDFGCFRANLPPLGCAAEVTFEKAWGDDGRDWSFPVAALQIAAKARRWTKDDFDRIANECLLLPGTAADAWKLALVEEVGPIKAWATSFGDIAAQPSYIEGDTTGERNPPWSRDELLLALELYLKQQKAPFAKGGPEVQRLSELLSQMGRMLGRVESGSYRNVNGVYMKLMNFRRFDPAFRDEGKSGLSRGNKDEEVVWNLYVDAPAQLKAVCDRIREAVANHESDGALAGEDELGFVDGEEGKVVSRLHRYRERDPKLAKAAKDRAFAKSGRLICQACTFDFTQTYGDRGAGVIDVHHTKPVHTMSEGERTRVEDLALLCSNCHRIVHAKKKWLTLEELTDLLNILKQS